MGLRSSGAAVAVVLLAFLLVIPGLAGAQQSTQPEASGPAAPEASSWAVASARMEADLRAGDGGAEVRIQYVFVGTTSGAPLPLDRPIPIELLGFADATAVEVFVGAGAAIALRPTVGSHREAVISPRDVFAGDALGGNPTPNGTLSVDLSYRVERAVEVDGARLRGRIPAVTGPTPSPDGSGFHVTLLLPDDWVVADGFPSGLRRAPSGAYEVSLPVVPAMVGFRARSDGRWRPGLPLVIDLLTLVLLTGFAAFGWRHLRSVAAEAAA